MIGMTNKNFLSKKPKVTSLQVVGSQLQVQTTVKHRVSNFRFLKFGTRGKSDAKG
jgi:hypothetical protein